MSQKKPLELRNVDEIGRFSSNIMQSRRVRIAIMLGGVSEMFEFHRIKVDDENQMAQKWSQREKRGTLENIELLLNQCYPYQGERRDKLEHLINQLKMETLTHADLRAIGGAVDELIEASWPKVSPPATMDEMVAYISSRGGEMLAQLVTGGRFTRQQIMALYGELKLIALEEAAINAGASVAQARSFIRPQPKPPAAKNGVYTPNSAGKKPLKRKLEVVGDIPTVPAKAIGGPGDRAPAE